MTNAQPDSNPAVELALARRDAADARAEAQRLATELEKLKAYMRDVDAYLKQLERRTGLISPSLITRGGDT